MARLPTRPARPSTSSAPADPAAPSATAPTTPTAPDQPEPTTTATDIEAQRQEKPKPELPPRRTEPTDMLLCVLNPTPMFAYHSGDRRFVWPAVVAQFAALCLWVNGTSARISTNSVAEVKESWLTFVKAPLAKAWNLIGTLPGEFAKGSKSTLVSKEYQILAAIAIHLALILLALHTFATQNDAATQSRADATPRPVHPTDYVMLVIDDASLCAFHNPNRAASAIKSVMRVLFVFSYLPQGFLYLVGASSEGMNMVNWIMFSVHVGMSGYGVWTHQQLVGITNDF